MTKSSFETLYKVLQAIPSSFLDNARDFNVECARLCIEHGWTLEEYDAEEQLWLKTLDKTEDNEHIRCIVANCRNHTDEGYFHGELCMPCYDYITTGTLNNSQACRNAFRTVGEAMMKVVENGSV